MKDWVCKNISKFLPIALVFLFSNALVAQPRQIKSENGEFYKTRGLTHLEKREYDQAIQDFNKALRINPEDAYTYYSRGRVYGERCEYDLAISDCTDAIKINPQFGDAYFIEGLSTMPKVNIIKPFLITRKLLRLTQAMPPPTTLGESPITSKKNMKNPKKTLRKRKV